MSGKQATELLNTSFSTTTSIESTAHALVFMDIVKSYYDYTVVTRCGIPYVEIAGDKKDWQDLTKIREDFLPRIKLSAWNEDLQDLLTHFISAVDMWYACKQHLYASASVAMKAISSLQTSSSPSPR